MEENLEVLSLDDMSRQVATNPDEEPHTVTVAEASEMFAVAGLPRTERAIQRLCKKGELKSSFIETPFGSKYLIAHSSVERLIVQKRQAQKFASEDDGRDLSRPNATGRDLSRHSDPPSEAIEVDETTSAPFIQTHSPHDKEPRQAPTSDTEDADAIRKLREENLGLKIDNAGKQNFISQLVNEREKLMTNVQDLSYRLGAAETRVIQLEAPRPQTNDMSRHVATLNDTRDAPQSTALEDGDNIPTKVNPPAPTETRPVKRSVFRKLFGN
jgi:hypothetical protein